MGLLLPILMHLCTEKKLYDCKYKFKENYFPLYFFYAVWWIIKRRIKHIMQSSKLPFIPRKWFCSSLKLL